MSSILHSRSAQVKYSSLLISHPPSWNIDPGEDHITLSPFLGQSYRNLVSGLCNIYLKFMLSRDNGPFAFEQGENQKTVEHEEEQLKNIPFLLTIKYES